MSPIEHIKQVAKGLAFVAAQELAYYMRIVAHRLDKAMNKPRELSRAEFAAYLGWTEDELIEWMDTPNTKAKLAGHWCDRGLKGPTWLTRMPVGLFFVAELLPGQVGYRVC